MKIDIIHIIKDHFLTLRDSSSDKISNIDITIFIIIPIVMSIILYAAGISVPEKIYDMSATFFGIFIALLLNIQVAVFAIFQRKWDFSTDERIKKIQLEQYNMRREILSELNTNISYLIIFCCVSLIWVIVCSVICWTHGLGPALTLFFYIHFLTTLLMIIKRSHALFQKEYENGSDDV